MKNRSENLELAKTEISQTAIQIQQTAQRESNKNLVNKMLGAITAMDAIAYGFSSQLNSQVMRGMEKIEREKLYLELGYGTFVEFLSSDDSPITKSQYYERIKLINNEGDALYDALSKMSFPVSKRKLLNKGAISIEGDSVIVKSDAGIETQIELNDRARLLETLSALADSNAEKTRKLAIGIKDNENLKRQLAEASASVAQVGASSSHVDEIETVRIAVTSLLARLADLLSDESLLRCEQFLNEPFSLMVSQWNRVQDVLSEKLPGSIPDERAVAAAAKFADYTPDESIFDDDDDD